MTPSLFPSPEHPLHTGTPTQQSAAEWRRLGSHLWAGRLNGLPIGTIEQGHRWIYTDVDGTVTGGLRSFDAATRLAQGLEVPASSCSAAARVRFGRLAAGGALVLAAVGTIVFAGMELVSHLT